MDKWVPLMEIFMSSPCPETEASEWLQQSFSTTSSTSHPISTSSFLSLLTKPQDSVIGDSSSTLSPPQTKRVLWIQTLPNVVQARIISFLACERERFSKRDLSNLARSILSESREHDFWVRKGAQQLLDLVSGSKYQWVSCLNLDSEEDKVEDEFYSAPDWLRNAASDSDLVLPWLPLSLDELSCRTPMSWFMDAEESLNEDEAEEESLDSTLMEVDVGHLENEPMNPDVEKMADYLKGRIIKSESTSKTVELANEIRQLCLGEGRHLLRVLGLIEPWKAGDEMVSILISHLSTGNEDNLAWPSYIVCSTVLPKFLILREPASRVLVAATIEYCKIHHKAAECALLFPLILRVDGINNPICDVITRIIKECLHPGHVSALCQKILCEKENGWHITCLPCHRCLIGDHLVWTESLFNLFQNILNHNVPVTHDSVDQLVLRVCESSDRFSKSLKFGNFLLSLVNKCASQLISHKLLLTQAVERTSTLVTKSILSKLASL